MGPAPEVPETDTGLVQFCVIDLGLIICDVRSRELQNLRISLSHVLHLIRNWENAVTWSSSYEGSRASLAQTTASALSCAPVPQEDEPRKMRSCPLVQSTAFHHLRKLWAFAMGQAVPLQPPLHCRQPYPWSHGGCSAKIPSCSFQCSTYGHCWSHMWLPIPA